MPLWCESVKARAAATDLLDEGCQPEEGAPKGQKAAKGGKAAPQKGAKAGKGCQTRPRQRSQHAARGEQGRENPGTDRAAEGATLAEIMKATSWQAHSVRGFLSTAAKKHGLKIESTKTDAGDRVYQIKK